VPTQITYLKFLKSVCFNEAGCEYYQTLYPSATPFLNLSDFANRCFGLLLNQAADTIKLFSDPQLFYRNFLLFCMPSR